MALRGVVYNFVRESFDFFVETFMAKNLEPLSVPFQDHHVRQRLCTTRPLYRRGRRSTAVKCFTIADESVYLLIFNVPTLNGVNVDKDLKRMCGKHGNMLAFGPVQYEVDLDWGQPPLEPFTHVCMVKYEKLAEAVRAKRSLDDSTLLGSTLHVSYAPEMESVEETEAKLASRQHYVKMKLAQFRNLTDR